MKKWGKIDNLPDMIFYMGLGSILLFVIISLSVGIYLAYFE